MIRIVIREEVGGENWPGREGGREARTREGASGEDCQALGKTIACTEGQRFIWGRGGIGRHSEGI